MADSPNVLDLQGREKLRQDLIAEIKKLGGNCANDISIDEARIAVKHLQESRLLPRSEPLHMRRTASEAHEDAERKPDHAVRKHTKKHQ